MQNVVLITIDSLRADHVGYHGYKRSTTPNIDSFAASGSRFMNAFAHVGGTQFSFPSILSGVMPLMHGGHSRISESQTLLSEIFSNAGYRTGGFHSNLYVSSEYGYERGWDRFYDSAPSKSITAQARRWAKTRLRNTSIYPFLQRGYDLLESSRGINIGSFHVRGEKITDLAIDFIDEAPEKPTFLWVHYMDVHHPFLPPREYQRMFRDTLIDDRDSIKLRRKFIEEPESITQDEFEAFIDLYDAEIRYTDTQVGRLLDAIENRWGEQAFIGLTADHGDHFLDRGYFGGAKLFDVKTHVPLCISGWNDCNAYDELVGLVDLPTTLLDVADLHVPETYQGYSLQRLVFNDDWPREDIIGGWENSDKERTIGIRERDWKFIKRPDGTTELYDLRSDPDEQNNVAEQNQKHVHRFDERLEEHLQRVDDSMDDSVERPNIDPDVRDRLRRLGYDE